MAFGLTRLNERHQRPNALINFIKPLEGTPHKDLSQDFLERIAAIVYPVMKAHTITVMTLEEFPPNKEFAGRNFNAGECIQLVLRSHSTGQWLSFRSVQMVMMHELAHCKHMNHARAFWAVRNAYADHLRLLWARAYLGEGVWGRGRTLVSGQFAHDGLPDAAGEGVESLCGGAYRGGRGRGRGRGRERKRKRALTYAERRDRRVERKFGRHGAGNELGEDFEVKAGLEKGRRTAARPRVAGSKRGRELRAAAALARFDKAVGEEASSSDAATARGDEDGQTDSDEYDDLDGPVLLDDRGEQIKDAQGNSLVRVCEAEDLGADDENVRREMEELRMVGEPGTTAEVGSERGGDTAQPISIKGDDEETDSEPEQDRVKRSSQRVEASHDEETNVTAARAGASTRTCTVCSLENEAGTATCMACAHVLDSAKIKGTWKCGSLDCSKEYLNAGDCGVCGLCGRPKAKQATDG